MVSATLGLPRHYHKQLPALGCIWSLSTAEINNFDNCTYNTQYTTYYVFRVLRIKICHLNHFHALAAEIAFAFGRHRPCAWHVAGAYEYGGGEAVLYKRNSKYSHRQSTREQLANGTAVI